MTTAQVRKIYGDPDDQKETSHGETWFYLVNRGHYSIPYYFDKPRTATFRFNEDGILTDSNTIGRISWSHDEPIIVSMRRKFGLSTLMKSSWVFVFLILGFVIASAQAENPPVPRPRPEIAIFAGGSFRFIQPAFDKTPGVINTVVGYCGGTEPSPTYETIKSGKTKYRESIEITYDPLVISFEQLLDIYWRQINPTQADGQFTDIGPSYRAAIFCQNEQERKLALISKEKLARSGKFDSPIVTDILPATKFYPAKAEYQKYYEQHPAQFAALEEASGRTSFRKKKWPER